MSARKPNPSEQELLDLILREVRRAKRMNNAQLSIIVDPFVTGPGFHVWVSEKTCGTTYECDGRGRARRYRR